MKRLFILFAAIAMASLGTAAQEKNDICSLNPRSEVLPELLSARKSVKEGVSSVTLLQFSDLHGDNENLQRIVEFRKAYENYIDDAIHCGDAVICYYDNPYPWEEVPGAGGILNTIGNHDCWKGHKLWSESDRPYDALQEDSYRRFFTGEKSHPAFVKQWKVVQPKGVDDKKSRDYCACYYYKDYEKAGLRLVVLDCVHYGEAQNEWFAETLADASRKGLCVLGVQHYVAQSGLDMIPSGFTSTLEPMDAVENNDGHQMERMPDSAFATVDDFIDKGGCFVCWLSGHTHFDCLGFVAGHDRQLQIIADKAGEWDCYMAEDRTRGSRNQDSFNLITINPSRQQLTAQKIGCRRNEKMQSKTLFCINYITKEISANE